MDKLQVMFPHIAFAVIYVINLLVTLFVVAFLSAVVFKVLPDAHIRWKDVVPGALIVSVLFMSGKLGISFYINSGHIASSYGSAGSMIILLLWIFYSSAVFYFGAVFTKAYSLKFADEIKPKKYAVIIKLVEVESDAKSVQQNEKAEFK